MNRFLKALKYASIVSVLINILFFIVGTSMVGVESYINDFIEISPVALSLSFIPTFLAISYLKSKNLLRAILKSASLSFVLVYLIVYLTLYFVRDYDVTFWNIPSLFNAIVSVVLTVFCALIYYVIINKLPKNREYKQIKISIKEVGLIWSIISVLSLFVASVLNKNMLPVGMILINAFFGIIASIIAFGGAKYIIKHSFKKNSNIIVGGVYLVNIILFPILCSISFSLLFNFPLSKPTLTITIIRAIVLYGSYLLLLTLFIHVYLIFKLNKIQKEHLKQIGVAASLKYQQLKAQLSPHFLFNNISVLTGLIEENQERAVLFSEKLSNIYRYFLNQENQDLVLLKEELKFAKEYLELLQVRFENAITFTNKIDNISEYYIIPMALQQVFENVIKHNEISTEAPMNIEMFIHKDFLVITNNKNPKNTVEKGKQIGLKNIMDRYAFFTDEKVIINNNEQQYAIKLPLLKIEV